MNYKETTAWLFSQLPMYQKQGASAYKADLRNTQLLDKHLNHPHKNFKSIHVAGTNGKGSTSHMLASVFQEAGYKVGLYTSPHLKDFRERIKINGTKISKDSVVKFISDYKGFFKTHQLSFFEMTVGMAFNYFSNQEVDIAIIEVGMGGRLDSTNIITPEISIITNIGLDHTKFLGDNLASIATEKAGIIKSGVPVVIGQTHPETREIFTTLSLMKKAPLFYSEDTEWPNTPSDLQGNYQIYNVATVLQALTVLKDSWKLSEKNIKNGLSNVIRNTGLLGRWQTLQEKPNIICDTAHNKEGLTLVLGQLLALEYKNLHIILGVVNDKDLKSILPLFPLKAEYYFCRPDVPRGLNAVTLQKTAKSFGLSGEVYLSVNEALESAKSHAELTDTIFVGGSTFTVAEII